MFAEQYGTFMTTLIVVLGIMNIVRMAFFMVGSDIYTVRHALRLHRKKYAVDRSLPTFSIVIPAYNEERSILRTIESVTAVRYPDKLLEIVVIDDGSTDKTVSLLENFLKTSKRKYKIVTQKNAGKAHALNNGMKHHTTGELVMCLDADSSLDRESVMNAAHYFIEDKRVVALSSNIKIRHTGTVLNIIQIYEYLVSYQMKRAQTIYNIEYIIGGIGSTFRRSALEKVGYYDTDTITEDIDLTMKLLRLGNLHNRVVYGSDVITYTESVLDIKSLVKQRFRWKYGRAQTFVKNRSLFFTSSRVSSRWLTWFYLPYAIFSDLAFFFEPFMVSYILFVVIRYGDWVTLSSALIIVGGYVSMNIVAEDTIPTKKKIILAVFAPVMYFCFYLLSYVEYIALLKTYAKSFEIPGSIRPGACGWTPVARSKR